MRVVGIKHILDHGGDVSGRISPNHMSFFHPESDTDFSLMQELRRLQYGTIRGWDVEIKSGAERIRGCLRAKKNPLSTAKNEKKRVRKHTRKNNHSPSNKTLELCGYTLIFTTLSHEKHFDEFMMKVYRLRWQIELIFKRLKSLSELGQLHKYDDLSIRTYLNGKMLIALLIEKMICMAETFPPKEKATQADFSIGVKRYFYINCLSALLCLC